MVNELGNYVLPKQTKTKSPLDLEYAEVFPSEF
jgi:hypothetical protein